MKPNSNSTRSKEGIISLLRISFCFCFIGVASFSFYLFILFVSCSSSFRPDLLDSWYCSLRFSVCCISLGFYSFRLLVSFDHVNILASRSLFCSLCFAVCVALFIHHGCVCLVVWLVSRSFLHLYVFPYTYISASTYIIYL